MPFQLFNTPNNGAIIGEGIQKAADSVVSGMQKGKEFAAKAKTYQNLVQSMNTAYGDKSPFRGVDVNSMSNIDMASALDQSHQMVSNFMDFQTKQEEAKKNAALTASYEAQVKLQQLEYDLLKKRLGDQTPSGIDTTKLTPDAAQALVEHADAIDQADKMQYSLENVYSKLPARGVNPITGAKFKDRAEEIKALADITNQASTKAATWSAKAGKQMRDSAEDTSPMGQVAAFFSGLNPLRSIGGMGDIYNAEKNGNSVTYGTPDMPQDLTKLLQASAAAQQDPDVAKYLALANYKSSTPTAQTQSPMVLTSLSMNGKRPNLVMKPANMINAPAHQLFNTIVNQQPPQ